MKIDVEKFHKLFRSDKKNAEIAEELGVSESYLNYALVKLRKTEADKWPSRKENGWGGRPMKATKQETPKQPPKIEATYPLRTEDTPANGPVVTYTLSPKEIAARYGPAVPYDGPDKKPITWNAQKSDKEKQEATHVPDVPHKPTLEELEDLFTTVIPGVGPDAPMETNEYGGKQSAVLYRFDLLDPKAMFAATEVLKKGFDKYGSDENWRRIPLREHLNHMLIHTYAHLAGDKQEDHLSHILCRAMFALGVEKDRLIGEVEHG